MESVGGGAKPGGGGIFAGNGKWYAIGALVAVGVILYLRRSSASAANNSSTTSTPATDSQNELNSLSDAVTSLAASLGTNGINGSQGGTTVSSTNAGATQPAASITGFAATAYPSLLGRPVESQSVADTWSNSGNITQQFLGISGSGEGLSHAEALPSAQYIQNQYSALGLGTADQGGLTYWQGELTQDIASTGSTNAGYIKEQQQFANSAAANPNSLNAGQYLPKK